MSLARNLRSAPATLALLLLVGASCEGAQAGELHGHVSIRSALRPRAVGTQQHGTPARSGGEEVGPGYGSDGGDDQERTLPFTPAQELQHVVVYLTGSGLKATPREQTIHQRDRVFHPHVLPVVKGSSVRFTNEDPYLHSIYSETSGSQFVLPKYARGAREARTFGRPGAVELFCGLHNRMNAYVFVVDNDAYTQPNAAGAYALTNLPPGTYTVHVWHPRLRSHEQRVTVPATGTVNLDLIL